VPDYRQELRFGTFLTPLAADVDLVLANADLSERVGLDLVTIQDHPYQRRFLDAWTLLTTIAARTSSVIVAPNVANLPLRPPAVLARTAASLDILSGGRFELGLGAGAFWDAVVAMGQPRRTPGEAVAALDEAISVIRAIWDISQRSARFEGHHYSVHGTHTGPPPAHPIEIWLGSIGPRMLRLTGARADGWLPSMGPVPVRDVAAKNALIDEGAAQAGRDPAAIRRLYNISGTFGPGAGWLHGSPSDWALRLADLTLAHGTSTYILASDDGEDIRRFGLEVAPAVRELVAAARS
jgi:alkanesulfonate monooxygenase SsuD/methylene tetrahydromethanopterin reductase-like flavin-dependent oxidoreductase (luciferase family)